MIVVCIESSHSRGMGHLFRMSYLVTEFDKYALDFSFVLNRDVPSLEILRSREFPAVVIDFDSPDWRKLIVQGQKIDLWIDDRMDTDLAHSEMLKSNGIPIVTFDNCGPGAALADLSIYGMSHSQQENLKGKKILTGLEWNLMDPQIIKFRRKRTDMQSLVIAFGGTDTYGLTPEIYGAVFDVYPNITIITGPGFRHESQLKSCINRNPHQNLMWKKNVPSLAEEFFLHDLAITAGGVTPFEANAAGLPCITIATELHEIENTQTLAGFGGSVYAGYRHEFDRNLVRKIPNIQEMSKRAIEAFPEGATQRIFNEILNLCPELRGRIPR